MLPMEDELIIITPEAAQELHSLAANGSAAVLRFDAEPDGNGSYDCSVGLVDAVPTEAKFEEIEGVSVAFCGMAESIFDGAVVGLNEEGELTLEMDEGDCESCGHDHSDGCGCGHEHGHGEHGPAGGCGCEHHGGEGH